MSPSRLRLVLWLPLLLLSACQFSFDRTLEPGELRGTVVARTDGTPVPAKGASVVVEGSRLVARADENGRFVLRGLPEGTYSLRITWDGTDADDVPEAGLVLRDVTLIRDAVKGLEGRELGTLVIAAFGAIEGVVKQNGEPVAGVRLAARGGEVGVSDALGRFRLARLSPGDYSVVAEVVDGSTTRLYASVPATVGAGAVAEISVVLGELSEASPGQVRGSARQLENPDWAGILVTLERPQAVGVERLVVGQTDADGAFESSAPLPPGVWTLVAQAIDGAAVRVSPFVVNGDTDAGRLLLPLASEVDDDDDDGVPDEKDGFLDADSPLLVEGAAGAVAVLAVHATDLALTSAEGVEVSFTSHLTLSALTVTTDASGLAQVSLTLPAVKGEWPVVASRAGADPVLFLVRVTTVPAVGFVVHAPPVITVGEPFEFVVEAVDALGESATDYRGTVTLSTQGSATFTPSTHAFDAADEGAFTFSATFTATGEVTLTVTDDGAPALHLDHELRVFGGEAVEVQLEPSALPLPGAPTSWTVRLRDAGGNVADGFEGTLTMRSTDVQAIHPRELVFSLSDAGTKEVDVTFGSAGSFDVSVTDGASLQALESVVIEVSPPSVEVVPLPAVVNGVVDVEVIVKQDESLPVDLELEVLRAGFRNGLTQARGYAGDGSSGRMRLASSPEGVAHRLRWDSVYNVGSQSSVTIFAKPTSWGVAGAEASTPSFAVENGASFQSPQPLPSVVAPEALVLADLDGDGLVELVACEADGSLVVTSPEPLRPAAPQTLLTGQSCGKLAAFDVDSDGDTDLVLMNPTAQALVVLDNAGGTFASRTLDLSSTGTPVDFAVTQLDADREADFAVAYAGVTGVWLHRSDAASGWQAAEQLGSTEVKTHVAWADINHDGESDLLALGTTVEAWRNTGGGTLFTPYEDFTPLAVGSGNPTSMVVADFSGDRRPDVVIGSDLGTLSLFMASSAGQFGTELVSSLARQPTALVAVDFDRKDGADLVALYASPGLVQVLRLIWDSQFVVMADHFLGDQTEVVAAGFVRPERAAAVVLGATSSGASVLFGRLPVSERVGRRAQAVALPGRAVHSLQLVDVDGDGRDDLLAATSGRPALMPGAGDGHFDWSEDRLEAVAGVSLVRGGDIDGDGRVDVVLVDPSGPRVGVQRGSDSGLLPAVWTTLSATPVSVDVADLDKDGRADVVTLDGDGSLGWLRSVGDGSFEAPVYTAGTATASRLVVADLDRDGLLDAAVLDADGVRVMKGQGDGSFVSLWTLPGAFADVVFADFNADGFDDWLVARGAAGDAVIYEGSATGPTTTTLATLGGRAGANVVSVDAADQTGDGLPDVVLADRTGQVRYFENPVGMPVQAPVELAMPSPEVVRLARLTEAGSFQLVVSSAAGGLHVFDQRDGVWRRPPTGRSLPAGPNEIVLNDGDADGDADLCVGTVGTDFLAFESFGSDLSFSPVATPSTNPARWVATGRFDTEPGEEVAVGGGTTVLVHRSTSSGLWSAASSPVDFGRPLSGLAAADVSGDGLDDLVAISSDGFLLIGLNNRGFSVAEQALGFVATALAVADVDQDLHADAIVADGSTSRLVVYNSDGVTAPVTVNLPFDPVALAAGDLDHDGAPELVVACADGVTRVLRRGGDGRWTMDQAIELGAVGRLAVGDLNLDGVPDVAASMPGAGAVVVMHGTGDGRLGSLEAWGGAMHAGDLAVGRVNDDEIPDLLIVDEQTGELKQILTELEGASGDTA